MRVTAVIVTYNRLKLLKECLESVVSQTRTPDSVVVVDNNCTDGTSEWLAEFVDANTYVSVLLLDKNVGGAGGFYYGMKSAYEMGSNWIWLLDDDTIPHLDALERLTYAASLISAQTIRKTGFLASQVNWTDGARHKMNLPGVAFNWWDGFDGIPCCIRLSSASFVSILVSREAVKTMGYPVKEFFIWRDDVEYTRRLTKGNFFNYYVEASKVVHKTPENRGVDYANIQRQDLWRWKYGARNLVAVERGAGGGILKGLQFVAFLARRMSRTKVPYALRIPILWAGIKGLFFKYERLIVYPSSD